MEASPDDCTACTHSDGFVLDLYDAGTHSYDGYWGDGAGVDVENDTADAHRYA